LASGQHSATDFSQGAGWNPFTAANIPLFGVITLGYLGVNLPLNLAGELFARRGGGEKEKRRVITNHLLWGSLIVLVCYLLSTFGVLVVQGQNASFVLFAPVSTVSMALGKIAGEITAVCIMATLFIAAIAYNVVFARFLMVGGMDRRLPRVMGQLNHSRVPRNAILFQTILACVLAALFFMVIPYIGLMSASPTHLAASFYFVIVGTATVLWAFATLFLFVDLLRLMIRQPQLLRRYQILPRAILYISCLIGFVMGVAAIIDTILNSYDPPDIPNNFWLLFVTGLTLAILILGSIGGMFGSSQANFETLEDAIS
jgi:glutamate:GABA antiporter